MKRTTIKRLRSKSAQKVQDKVFQLRRSGRSAWAEQDGDVHILCVRMEVVCVQVQQLLPKHLAVSSN